MNKKTKKQKPEQTTRVNDMAACKKRARMLRKQDRLFSRDPFSPNFDCGSTIEDADYVSFEFRYA